MPQRVDAALRREQVADAVIDEIAAHGLRSVTLAKIAARSGLAIGSIRHYFGDTLREVMRFTLSVIIERAQHRNPVLSTDPAERIIDAITAVAPTSPQEHKENIALAEYRMMARTDPELAADITEKSVAAMDALRSLLRDVLRDRDIDDAALQRETFTLHSLVEGVSFGSALLPSHPHESDVRAITTSTLDRIRDAYPLVAE